MDESYERLAMYDLRMSSAARQPPAARSEAVEVFAEVRGGAAPSSHGSLLDTQVEVVGSDHEVLVVGQIMGVETRDGGPHVNQVFVEEGGRELTADDRRGRTARTQVRPSTTM
jgi:hypothetical protein